MIIFDKHFAVSIALEIFGLENHACCYWHLKDNFNIFLTGIMQEGTRIRKVHLNKYYKCEEEGISQCEHG